MSNLDSFILRWARLKRASAVAHSAEAISASAEISTPKPHAEGAPAEPLDPTTLPPLGSITADTDISAFLRSGVPAALTRAALRRAWASDPAIRDFIGIAENQWDFNDPDAIPGFGPLPAADGLPVVFTEVSSIAETIPEALRELAESVEREPLRVTGPKLAPDESCCARSGISDLPEEADQKLDVSLNRRQHGSALPR